MGEARFSFEHLLQAVRLQCFDEEKAAYLANRDKAT